MAVHEHVRARPAPHLRRYAASYTGYRTRGGRPATHRGLPSPYLTLILTLDEPLRFARHLDPRTPPSEHQMVLGGLHDRPAMITHDGNQSGVQVGLEPLGARALLGVPAADLWSVDLDAADVFGPWLGEIRERLLDAADWPARFAVVDDLLTRAERTVAERRSAVADEVAHVWRRLLTSGGTSRIGRLVSETGWSEKHLTSRFAAETGVGPKQAARMMRFYRASRAVAAWAAAGRGTLAGIAADSGYYDQSHMVRDFQQFAGCSPTAWAAEEFGNIQSGGDQSAVG
jgi:AraC-like DNA-binding protein